MHLVILIPLLTASKPRRQANNQGSSRCSGDAVLLVIMVISMTIAQGLDYVIIRFDLLGRSMMMLVVAVWLLLPFFQKPVSMKAIEHVPSCSDANKL